MKASATVSLGNPYYAPGLKIRHRKDGSFSRIWLARPADKKIGFHRPYVRFSDDATELDVAEQCRQLTHDVCEYRKVAVGSGKAASWQTAKSKAIPDISGYDGPGGVYFLQAADREERIKIGYTLDIDERVATLAAGCPYPLKVLGFHKAPPEAERYLHWKFRHARIHLEWFRQTGDIVRYAVTFPMQKEHDATKARTPVLSVPPSGRGTPGNGSALEGMEIV